jgi:type IV pilus assembly protein PilN
MRIAINLATRPFADLGPALRKLRIAMGVLALLAIGLAVGLDALHYKAQAVRARERSVDTAIAQVNHERQGYQNMLRQPDNAQVLDQVQSLNKLIDAKAFSWTLAMEDLETVLPGGVQVTTLEPTVDKKDGHITVRMRVVGPRDKAVDLVQNLEHSRRFLQPRIVGEASEASGNGTQQQLEPVSATNRVSFNLLADYNPPMLGEPNTAATKPTTEAPDNATTPAVPATRRTGRPGRRAPYTRPARPHAGGPR